MWKLGEPTKMEMSNVPGIYHGQHEGCGDRNGREETISILVWRPSKFPGCSSEKRELETGSWPRTVIGKLQSHWPVTCPTTAPAWQAGSFLTQWSDDYPPKTWPQRVPSKDPWNAAANEHTGHQGSLDILKMCFRYLGTSVETFFQRPHRAGAGRGQQDTSGTGCARGAALFRSLGHSVTSGL